MIYLQRVAEGEIAALNVILNGLTRAGRKSDII